GWALAVDIRASRTKKMTYGSAEYKWLMENAYKVGWVNPPSMRQGASGPDEPWHWEYAGSTSGASDL
ncbi:MAG: D-alanyl-D-alanine carboxypeptidase family protein, partial [Acidobacteriota bacterium]